MPAKLFITDIDNTLLGDREAIPALFAHLRQIPDVRFGVATGRRIDSAIQVLEEWQVPRPDFFITSVGSEIYSGHAITPDAEWRAWLDYAWDVARIREHLQDVPNLTLQPEIDQREYKLSYFVNDPSRAPPAAELRAKIHTLGLQANVIYSHNTYLDILPVRASKGLAVAFLQKRWQIEHVLVSGDSGNDEDMLRGSNMAVVVGNFSRDLAHLRGERGIYFAQARYAAGVLEGMKFFGF